VAEAEAEADDAEAEARNWQRKKPQGKTDDPGSQHSEAWPSQQVEQRASSAPPMLPCTAPSAPKSAPQWGGSTTSDPGPPSSGGSARRRASSPSPGAHSPESAACSGHARWRCGARR